MVETDVRDFVHVVAQDEVLSGMRFTVAIVVSANGVMET